MPTCTRTFLALYFGAISSNAVRESHDAISVCSCGWRTRAPPPKPKCEWKSRLTRDVTRPRSTASADEVHLVICSMRGAGPLAAQFTGRKGVHVTAMSPAYLSVAFLMITAY